MRSTGSAPPKVNANWSGDGTKVMWSIRSSWSQHGFAATPAVKTVAEQGDRLSGFAGAATRDARAHLVGMVIQPGPLDGVHAGPQLVVQRQSTRAQVHPYLAAIELVDLAIHQ